MGFVDYRKGRTGIMLGRRMWSRTASPKPMPTVTGPVSTTASIEMPSAARASANQSRAVRTQ